MTTNLTDKIRTHVLATDSPFTVGDVAHALDCARTTAASTLNTMVHEGLLFVDETASPFTFSKWVDPMTGQAFDAPTDEDNDKADAAAVARALVSMRPEPKPKPPPFGFVVSAGAGAGWLRPDYETVEVAPVADLTEEAFEALTVDLIFDRTTRRAGERRDDQLARIQAEYKAMDERDAREMREYVMATTQAAKTEIRNAHLDRFDFASADAPAGGYKAVVEVELVPRRFSTEMMRAGDVDRSTHEI